MGIPSYFSYIVKKHASIIQKYNKTKITHNLYLDCNSIIYDVYNSIDADKNDKQFATTIIQRVILKIEEYIALICPQTTVIIAFDGVAPVAKLEQQRARRYKSWYQNELSANILKKGTVSTTDAWNTASITPGTKFMAELNKTINAHFTKKSESELQIIVTDSSQIGEGEHKLFAFIRDNPEKHLNESTVIYGLDADLIMLSINHLAVCPNIFLFRETPHFIQSIDSSLEPNANYVLDIPELATNIVSYMSNNLALNAEQRQHRIYDYIFLCFFLGNDFLPHFPALNIRTGGIDKLLNAYKATIGQTTDKSLVNGKTIYWHNVRKFIEYLVPLEEEYIVTEHRMRNKKERYTIPDETPEQKLQKIELIPTYEREMERYINPVKPKWQHRYYYGLFGLESPIKDEKIGKICINYLEGLEWTMKYYTTNCPNWRWKYNYQYPPLLQDLIRYIPNSNTEFVPQNPINAVTDLVQLCYVLPQTSLRLLPPKLYAELMKKYAHWYKGNWNFAWAYCRYFWEAHVEMNEIDIEELEKITKNI
jgi:5'-3' exonuclease